MFLNVGSIRQSKLLLLIVLLNPCFIFPKNLILLFIDKVTTGTYLFEMLLQLFVLLLLPEQGNYKVCVNSEITYKHGRILILYVTIDGLE